PDQRLHSEAGGPGAQPGFVPGGLRSLQGPGGPPASNQPAASLDAAGGFGRQPCRSGSRRLVSGRLSVGAHHPLPAAVRRGASGSAAQAAARRLPVGQAGELPRPALLNHVELLAPGASAEAPATANPSRNRRVQLNPALLRL
uniref:Collagen alpha-1(I) chain-like n=1 Tax=Macrostomum lignano TaxID=282301 RepID=A0A1I8H7L5_9PLAT